MSFERDLFLIRVRIWAFLKAKIRTLIKNFDALSMAIDYVFSLLVFYANWLYVLKMLLSKNFLNILSLSINSTSSLFGIQRGDALKAVISNLKQTFDKTTLYKTNEERASIYYILSLKIILLVMETKG